jgi:AP2 domain/HNH endonuclease
MREIPLTKGYVAIVDDEDYVGLMQFKWHAQVDQRGRLVYAHRWDRKADGRRENVSMHRQILGLGPREMADHVNGNGLDNRRENLRACTNQQNQRNREKVRTSINGRPSSPYKGVRWNPNRNRWVGEIKVDGRSVFLGHHRSEEDAARAYDAAALQHFGDFARLNFPAPVAQVA